MRQLTFASLSQQLGNRLPAPADAVCVRRCSIETSDGRAVAKSGTPMSVRCGMLHSPGKLPHWSIPYNNGPRPRPRLPL